MLRLGLTGGIASGKSAVAAILREMGFAVLDAYDEVVREFGPAVLDAHNRVDRAKLAAVVFADGAKLDRLNAIVHPRVKEAMNHQFQEWARNGARDAVFVEAALLVEAGYQKDLDGLVVAWSRPEQQLERLRSRGLRDEEARRRIAAQLPVAEKLRYATEKIDCSGSLEDTRRQVAALAAKLRKQTLTPQTPGRL
jgi:dephospho-CoA kinase